MPLHSDLIKLSIEFLIIVAYWRHIATEIWFNIGSGIGLLPDGTKPLPKPMLTDHQKSNDIHIMAISQEKPQSPITKICLKVACPKLHSNFPGANELKLVAAFMSGSSVWTSRPMGTQLTSWWTGSLNGMVSWQPASLNSNKYQAVDNLKWIFRQHIPGIIWNKDDWLNIFIRPRRRRYHGYWKRGHKGTWLN